MSAFYGILLHVSMSAVMVIGLCAVYYLALLALAYVFKETLVLKRIWDEFVEFRSARKEDVK